MANKITRTDIGNQIARAQAPVLNATSSSIMSSRVQGTGRGFSGAGGGAMGGGPLGQTDDQWPAWVVALRSPAGDLPRVALDFENGLYWIAGQLVELDDAVTENAAWGTWDPETGFVESEGLVNSGKYNAPVLSDLAYGAVTSMNYTVVMVATVSADDTYADVTSVDLPSQALQWTVRAGVGDPNTDWCTQLRGYNDGHLDRVEAAGTDSPVRVAATVSRTRMALSRLGDPVVSVIPGLDVLILPTAIGLEAPTSGFLHRVLFYPPVEDAALVLMSAAP